jgi:hypothetical protein
MSENHSSYQLGFFSILALIFITLKLCGVIAWSWLVVLSPIWLPLILGLVLMGIGAILMRIGTPKE